MVTQDKKNQPSRASSLSLEDVDVARVASAVNRLCAAASGGLGSDCLLQAYLSKHVFEQLGIPAKVQFGFAVFRIAQDDGSVISHAPMPGMTYQPNALPYHAWIEVGDRIFDCTTSQLRLKAQKLDELDGGTTSVEWCPDFLYVTKDQVSSFYDVQQGGAGLFFYEPNEKVAAHVLKRSSTPDQIDLARVWQLYENPELAVYGPNDIDRAMAQMNSRPKN